MDYSKLDGLIPAVIQDADSSEVLMVGFMNEQALAETRRTGFATFFSRTRNKLWTKGETSGNRLQVVEMLTDCDDDTVLVKVKRLGDGNVCHTGQRTCFNARLSTGADAARSRQWREIGLGAQILKDLGISSIRLLTSSKRTYVGLGGFGIEIEATEPIES